MARLYLVGKWLIVQVASTVFPAFEFPNWALRGVILLLAIGESGHPAAFETQRERLINLETCDGSE